MVQILSLAGTSSKLNRYNKPTHLSFAYTQTIIRLYPNSRAPIRKRSFGYRQIETFFSKFDIRLQNILYLCGKNHPIY